MDISDLSEYRRRRLASSFFRIKSVRLSFCRVSEGCGMKGQRGESVRSREKRTKCAREVTWAGH